VGLTDDGLRPLSQLPLLMTLSLKGCSNITEAGIVGLPSTMTSINLIGCTRTLTSVVVQRSLKLALLNSPR
jgi:hypothetical protein